MARTPKEPITDDVIEEQGFHNSHKSYDECLISIVRESDGTSTETTGIEVMKVIRKDVRIDEGTKDALNVSQDHMNTTNLGMPVIKWYLPSGTVKNGDVLKAEDIYKTNKRGDYVRRPDGTYIILGLKIHEPNAVVTE